MNMKNMSLIILFGLQASPILAQAVPAKYKYPELVCGKPLPAISETTRVKLSELFNQCLAAKCHQPASYSDQLAQQISQTVFAESREWIAAQENADLKTGHTVLCTLFGKESLDYVNCAYKASANLNYQGDSCEADYEDSSPTLIWGPNRATLTLELRQKDKDAQFNFHGQYVRFPGLKEGFTKARLLQNLNCESLTASQSQSRTLPLTGGSTPTRSLSLSASQTKSFSESNSDSSTVSESKSLSKSATLTSTKSLDRPTPVPPTPVPPTPAPTVLVAYTAAATDVNLDDGRLAIQQNVPALTWELGRKGTAKMNWAAAKAHCGNKGSGWRLPTIWELFTLSKQKSVLNGDYDADWYWSSTPMSGDARFAWLAIFKNTGVSNSNVGGDGGFVRCVLAL